MRKVISQTKKQPANYLVTDFIYGYSNNAGVNISNIDVLLMSMQRYFIAQR